MRMLVLCVAATSPPPPPPPPPSPRGVWRASCLSHLTRPRRPARKGKGRTRAKLCRSRKLERPGKEGAAKRRTRADHRQDPLQTRAQGPRRGSAPHKPAWRRWIGRARGGGSGPPRARTARVLSTAPRRLQELRAGGGAEPARTFTGGACLWTTRVSSRRHPARGMSSRHLATPRSAGEATAVWTAGRRRVAGGRRRARRGRRARWSRA
mmetsp:Transcript_8578/g.16221  ORF Transcript_8578/g.16221 Transcript_8578/m.16221 type:complete len:209 (+) Transcript_8578:1003-1629(+)